MVYKRRGYKKGLKRTGRKLKQTATIINPGASSTAYMSGIDPTGYFKAFRASDRSAQRTRARAAMRVRRKRNREEQGGYSQFTNEASTFGRVLRTNMKNKLLLKSAKESMIFSFKSIKNFDDNGANFLKNAFNATDRQFPVYALLLNGRNVPGSPDNVNPLRGLYCKTSGANDARLDWRNEAGNDLLTGALNNTVLNTEYQPDIFLKNASGQKLYWDWSEIKLNLWGSKNKSIKYVIQIVKVMEDTLSPWHLASAQPLGIEAQQTWEETIKQFTFNPITKLNYEKRPKIKVLKTWERIIQPTSTTENDVDPHVHVLKWFSRWNRVVHYDRVVEAFNEVGGVFRTMDDADYNNMKERTQEWQQPYSHYPEEKDQVFLLIRASAYTEQAFEAVSNATCGSFDVSMRSKFSVLD